MNWYHFVLGFIAGVATVVWAAVIVAFHEFDSPVPWSSDDELLEAERVRLDAERNGDGWDRRLRAWSEFYGDLP